MLNKSHERKNKTKIHSTNTTQSSQCDRTRYNVVHYSATTAFNYIFRSFGCFSWNSQQSYKCLLLSGRPFTFAESIFPMAYRNAHHSINFNFVKWNSCDAHCFCFGFWQIQKSRRDLYLFICVLSNFATKVLAALHSGFCVNKCISFIYFFSVFLSIHNSFTCSNRSEQIKHEIHIKWTYRFRRTQSCIKSPEYTHNARRKKQTLAVEIDVRSLKRIPYPLLGAVSFVILLHLLLVRDMTSHADIQGSTER